MAVPYTFGSATAAIPLSQLDSNFATTITLGNTAIQLGNTVTTLNNMTLANVTINGGTSNIAANVTTATGLLPEANGGTGTTTGYYGFKNRIINGNMAIDQRNAGALINVVTNTEAFPVDRWVLAAFGGGTLSGQQSTSAPTGYVNSVIGTVTATDTSLGTSDVYEFTQRIEGYNTADLGWGAAGASSVSLSFWVKSTGLSYPATFSVGIENAAGDRAYVVTYTVNASNTWEQKTFTIPGDTTGTWLKTTGIGIQLRWCLATGTNRVGPSANVWSSGNYIAISSTANPIMGTNGATLSITGAQLEKGSAATSFDFRSIGTELMLCQRYFEKSYDIGTAVATNTQNGTCSYSGSTQGSGIVFSTIFFAVNKRTAPTVTMYSETGTSGQWYYERSGASGFTTSVSESISERQSRVRTSGVGANFAAASVYGHWVASSEL